MRVFADLHLHGRYSRAVSRQMEIPQMVKWAKIKGLDLLAAPDWTHPFWLNHLRQELEEKQSGLFGLKNSKDKTRLLLVTEVSSIYSQGGKLRRIHNLITAPSFATAEKINQALMARGAKLKSDGRPIIGLSAIDLCDLVFFVSSDSLIIPAHAWTPWFSLYGANSGFDSIEEAFGKFSRYIYAVETGLSSDPAMNWRIGELEKRRILSFSDSHSLAKMGREATIFEMEREITYGKIAEAIRGEGKSAVAGTIEFYPEEGKYHFSGHRNCGVKHAPEETKKLGTTCPVCGKKLTLGVAYRVESLTDNEASEQTTIDDFGVKWIGTKSRPRFARIVPLAEVLAETIGLGISSQKVSSEYFRLVNNFGSEMKILLETTIREIGRFAGERIAEGIRRVRNGELFIDPGYDGVYGKVKIWTELTEAKKIGEQQSLAF